MIKGLQAWNKYFEHSSYNYSFLKNKLLARKMRIIFVQAADRQILGHDRVW
jgi:hypothetical protein